MKKMKQKDINRENLLNYGVMLLTQQGYHGTGLQEILDAVQVPKGSFYNYFSSKETFAAEIIEHYIAPYLLQLQTYLNESNGHALGALERYLNENMAELEKTQFKGGCLLGNLTGEISDTSDICREALQQALGRYRDVWEMGFYRAQKEGSIRNDKTARELADLWVNSWQGALLRMKIEQSIMPLKQCKEAILDDFFKA